MSKPTELSTSDSVKDGIMAVDSATMPRSVFVAAVRRHKPCVTINNDRLCELLHGSVSVRVTVKDDPGATVPELHVYSRRTNQTSAAQTALETGSVCPDHLNCVEIAVKLQPTSANQSPSSYSSQYIAICYTNHRVFVAVKANFSEFHHVAFGTFCTFRFMNWLQ